MELFSQVEEPVTIHAMMFLMKKNRVAVFLSLFFCVSVPGNKTNAYCKGDS